MSNQTSFAIFTKIWAGGRCNRVPRRCKKRAEKSKQNPDSPPHSYQLINRSAKFSSQFFAEEDLACFVMQAEASFGWPSEQAAVDLPINRFDFFNND